MALISEVSIGDRTLVTYNLHLECRGEDTLRCSQLVECFNDARSYKADTPIILAGDLNMDVSRSAAAAAAWQAQFHSSFTQRSVPTTPAGSLFDRGRAIDGGGNGQNPLVVDNSAARLSIVHRCYSMPRMTFGSRFFLGSVR